MLSGNGRHRRPRQAPALLVAAGVTGSAIAIPLLGATGASAASGTTWDKVAECESGGSWSAATGNGYYGGLQLSQEDWEKNDGLEYAPSPDQASRSQQIAVAERILADEGVGAWPTCGLTSGLGEDTGSADVDTGVGDDSSDSSGSTKSSHSPDSSDSDSSDSSKSSDSSGSSDSPDSSSSPSDAAEDSTKSDTGLVDTSEGDSESDSSGANGTKDDDPDDSGQGDGSSGSGSGSSEGADTASGTGRHRGGSADESATGAPADGVGGSAGRHASRSGDSAQDADVADGSYTVREGDNLSVIADSLGMDGGWSELYAENKKTVGSDPDLILPGQTLDVSAETGEK
ncbi:transglycosylase family protein [Streptomyces phyllanthi]|uniref:LysM peptidoglycan-binding domain-containing protein n=1 Tax=Streptomyces phyllanthi TaxID=1803180 RepID=A0A5N8WH37_9ACTN|nr:transglycosylase family protein [Streptomyces phyllanthi]MPY46559.1 LysM peptidoglycan-binding domain-containing protein [Streptomyces phyllanthi]